jgi:hypothetical protein
LNCIAATCVVLLFPFSLESFAQAPDRNKTEKAGEVSLECATELEQLSTAIETYLSERATQRQMPVSEFANALKSLLPVAPCDTQTVESVLMRNRFFWNSSGNHPDLAFKFANNQLLVFVRWSGRQGTFIGTSGRVKFKPHDFR